VIRAVRSHLFTILATVLLFAAIAWLVLHPRPWYAYLAALAYCAAYGGYRVPRRGPEPPVWRPAGPSLPCPPGCRITAEHYHDRFA
jgi:hypothetical protein